MAEWFSNPVIVGAVGLGLICLWYSIRTATPGKKPSEDSPGNESLAEDATSSAVVCWAGGVMDPPPACAVEYVQAMNKTLAKEESERVLMELLNGATLYDAMDRAYNELCDQCIDEEIQNEQE